MPKRKTFAIGDKVKVITKRFDTSLGTQYGDIGEVQLVLTHSNPQFDYAVRFPHGARYYLECDLALVVDLKMTPPDMELDEIHRAEELMQ